jgi:hypothetical protein
MNIGVAHSKCGRVSREARARPERASTCSNIFEKGGTDRKSLGGVKSSRNGSLSGGGTDP